MLRVAGHSSNQFSRVWLSWRHFGHLGSVVGSIRCRYAASCILCRGLSLANMTASLLLVCVFSSLAVQCLAYTAAVLAQESGLSFRVRSITALAAFRLVGWASPPSSVASLANLSASSFPGMSMWPGTHWMDVAVHGIQATAQGGNIRTFIVQSGGQRLGVGADQYLVVLFDGVLFQPLDCAIHSLFLFFIGRCEDPSFDFLLVNRDRILRVALGHNHRRPAKVGTFKG